MICASLRGPRGRARARWPVLASASFFWAIAAGGCGPGPQPPGDGWAVVFADLPVGLTSVWGTRATDVWAVGGDPGDGTGPFVLHYDGTGWTRLLTGASGDLWWVFGFDGGPVWMGGRSGLLLEYPTGAFIPFAPPGGPTPVTVFGIWGAAPSDLWAVGGTGTSGAFAWRFDGASWTAAASFPASLATSVSLFKVWGLAANDVVLVGSSGTILRWDGAMFTPIASGTTSTIFTVHAAGGRYAAVGGSGTGVLLEGDGTSFANVSPTGVQAIFGVHLDPTLRGWAVGLAGAVLSRSPGASGAWQAVDDGLAVFQPLHAVWADPQGGVWAVGGDILTLPLLHGVLIHRGAPVPGGTYQTR